MMDFPLTLGPIVRRAETLFPHKQIVTRLPDGTFHRYGYADFARRTRQLSVALRRLGIRRGERVATLSWNHYQHLEAYFGVPLAGAVLHTMNLRLHASDLSYILNHAQDRALIIDESLLPLWEKIRPDVQVEHVIVVGNAPAGMIGYEELLAGADPDAFEDPLLDEREAAAMCYTSGTTGRPKGVVYSHRALVLQSFVQASGPFGPRESDVVLPVVPLFHVNGWGFPFTCTMVGATQVFPGPRLDPASLLDAFERERVTVTAGVPTIWLGILRCLDESPGRYDLSSMRALAVGGAAAPPAMIRGFEERHGLTVIHAWGMTETTPLGTVAGLTSDLERADPETRLRYRATQGLPVPFVEIRARTDAGALVHWDGKTMGELEVRGPWVACSYFASPESADRWTADGWFRTGDIVTIDPRGYLDIQDRAKDLIKSGGEWISSVLLEGALMSHPAIAEAAVVAIPDERWLERPLAVVVLKPGCQATADELRAHLAPSFAKWWLPDAFEFVAEIPKTGVGKFRKNALREQFAKRNEVTHAS
jgi:fatty-acyl-CoA synthase